MIRCKKCIYCVKDKDLNLIYCKLIHKIKCPSWYPIWDCCPFYRNRDSLIDYMITHFGDLELKFRKIAEKVSVVAILQRKATIYNDVDIIEVESKSFLSTNDAMADALYNLCKLLEIMQEKEELT